MVTITITEALWPCIEATIDYLVEQREERAPDPVKSGLNFSIILGSACYVEGVLEVLLRGLLSCRTREYRCVNIEDLNSRRALNKYYARIQDEFSRNIGRAAGASGYDELFTLLAGQRLSQLKKVKPLWESITVLFNFRNVLGHGRQVSARQSFGGGVPGGFREDFYGSYKVVEDYLRKKRLIDRRFIDRHSEFMFLSGTIADHFWELAKAMPEAILSSLSDTDERSCREALRCSASHSQVDGTH